MTKLTAKDVVSIEDGLHEGEIVEIKERTEPYHYLDFYVKLSDVELESPIKVGFPANLSVKSALGTLLERFGVKIESGKEYDIAKLVVGKKVKLQTMTNSQGFVNVIRDSVKPL